MQQPETDDDLQAQVSALTREVARLKRSQERLALLLEVLARIIRPQDGIGDASDEPEK